MKIKAVLIVLVVLMSFALLNNHSINKLEMLEIGGISQWIHIKGKDINNPILLVLHGGPGFAMMPLLGQINSDLEDSFTVVNWDQRGSGKSYSPNIPTESMSLDQFVLDAEELTHYLKETFNQDKIYILGHSFGSVIAMKLIKEYPENYAGYFATGQVVDFVINEQHSYDFALEQSIEDKNTVAIKALNAVGRPDAQGNYILETGYEETSKYIEYYGGDLYGENSIDPIYDLIFDSNIYKEDEQKLLEGYEFSQLLFDDENVRDINLMKDIKKVEVAVYFLLGRYDFDTPSKLAQAYYDVLEAPYKELIWFDQSAHFPFYEEADKFNEVLIDRVN